MNNKTKTGRNWNGQGSRFGEAIGGAWRLASRSKDISVAAGSPFYTEVRALASSHMPVLIHKFAKFSEGAAAGENSNWANELESFVTRVVWPHLVEDPARQGRDKACVVKLLDMIVAAERRKAIGQKADETIPYTSRFDSSWAI